MPVRPGLERLLDGPDRRLIDGKRVGLVSNPASVDSRLVHAADRLFGGGDWTLTTLFGPQHGFHSDLQENMIESPHARDAKRRLPVYSLYSETREPTARDAGRGRRARRRSAGRRHAHLHLHLHAGQLPARRRAARHPRRRLRSSEPDRRRRRRRGAARSGLYVVCRAVPDPDATRADDRRGGAALQRTLRAQRRRST